MKNRYEDSNYRNQNDNENNWRNTNQFNNEDRYRQSKFNYDSGQYRSNNSDRPHYDWSQGGSQDYTEPDYRDYQNRGDRNWYGRQYEGQYNSNSRQPYNSPFNDYGQESNERNFRSHDDYNNRDRGWWDKTTDEVSSWFGDEDAKRRRRMDELREDNHRGKGPKNYTRSSERIKEDVNDQLGDHWMLDASNIEVEVSGTEVTLNGTVNTKENKRRAEDIADSVSGVTHVQNNLRVTKMSDNNNDITSDDSSKANNSTNYKTRKEALSHN